MSWFSVPRGDRNVLSLAFPFLSQCLHLRHAKPISFHLLHGCLPSWLLLCPISLVSGCLLLVLQLGGLITLSSVTTYLQTGTLFLTTAPYPMQRAIPALTLSIREASAFLGDRGLQSKLGHECHGRSTVPVM